MKGESGKSIICFILLLFGIALPSWGQEISVSAKNVPLNEVLYQLRDQYGVQISFSERLVKQCNVSCSKVFKEPKEAIEYLIKDCALGFKAVNGVYVLFQDKAANPRPSGKSPSTEQHKAPKYLFSLKILDHENLEPLPYSILRVNGSQISADVEGNIHFHSQEKNSTISLSHLGFSRLDTTLKFQKSFHFLSMRPSYYEMETVIMESSTPTEKASLNHQPAHAKLNQKIADFLPADNNTLFTLLRLQPGILAAGEPSNDFVIWGSYRGQSQILYDGITVFKTSSLDDRIGAFNPMMIKDIEIHKAGHGVPIGDRIGGVINISGKTGHNSEFHSKILLSNQIFGNYFNIPIKKKASLQIAYRVALPDLFDPKTYRFQKLKNNVYGDANIKYSQQLSNGDDLRISLIGNNDINLTLHEQKDAGTEFRDNMDALSRQAGLSFFYGKNWNKGGVTRFTLAGSSLLSVYENTLKFQEELQLDSIFEKNTKTVNSMTEASLKIDHSFPAGRISQWSMGAWATRNQSSYFENDIREILEEGTETLNRLTFYAQNKLSLGKYFDITPGIRLETPTTFRRPSVQPRLKLNIKPHRLYQISVSAGRYSQYISQRLVVDPFGNFRYFWNISDSKKTPPLSGNHLVTSLTAQTGLVSWGIDAYYKTIDHLPRLFRNLANEEIILQKGQGRSYGLDLYGKLDIKKHLLWASYSWNKSEESFGPSKEYRPAAQDQRHEIKAAYLLNFDPFFTSANYVYGSGFPETSSYSRLDASFMYWHRLPKVRIEMGVSILNIFNTKNVKYTEFSRFPGDNRIFSNGTDFSPNLVIKAVF